MWGNTLNLFRFWHLLASRYSLTLTPKMAKFPGHLVLAHLKTGGGGGEESLRATQPQMNDEDTSTAIDSNF